MMTALRMGCTNRASHWLSKPAPPAPVSLVMKSLGALYRSSATLIFQPWLALISSLAHCIRDQASGMSPQGPIRIEEVESQRSPSSRYSSSHISTLSRMYWRTSGRP